MTSQTPKEQTDATPVETWEPPIIKVVDVLEQTMKVGISGPFDGGIKVS